MIRIKEIRAREQAATPGPWGVSDGDKRMVCCYKYSHTYLVAKALGEFPQNDFEKQSSNDANFIAHAREDIPFLLDEISRLTAEAEKAWKQLHEEIALEQEQVKRTEQLEAELAGYREAAQEIKHQYLDGCMQLNQRCPDYLELQKYREAEQDGRLKTLPCKYGDEIYYLHNGEVIRGLVFRIIFADERYMIEILGGRYFFDDGFDRTWFLTEKAAEAALQRDKPESSDGR